MNRLGKVLVLGGGGQLGRELLRVLTPIADVVAATRVGMLADGTACEIVDLQDPGGLLILLERTAPDWVVNAAAYTSVDRAESEKDEAWRINADAPALLSRWCVGAGTSLLHYSTDYVFDGSADRPYREDDPPGPLGVYGASKLAGEQAIREAGGRHLILRTAWVYASHSTNFLLTMLRLAEKHDTLKVVADQVGTPTSAALIAEASVSAMLHAGNASGTWHLTAQGGTTWHGFAEAIFEAAVEHGLLSRVPRVEAISTAEYPFQARRPHYSRLDVSRIQADFGVRLPRWEDGLARVMSEIKASSKNF